MSTAVSPPAIPDAEDLQVWPFGHGVICTALGGTIEHGVLIMTAVPDEFVPENWRDSCPHDWETVCSWPGQRCVMTFPTPESVDGLIGKLRDLRRNLASAIEARSATDSEAGMAEGKSAAPSGETPND